MTIYEHTMLGINGALATGLHRRYGWQIVALAGLASLLPDADGLTLFLGLRCYLEGHRIWTHNLLVAGIAAAIVSAVVYEADLFTRIQKWLMKRLGEEKGAPSPLPGRPEDGHPACTVVAQREPALVSQPAPKLWLWLAIGILAAYGHLLIDVFYSGGRGLPVWGVPLFWPFSEARYAYPLVTWGDVGGTLIFIASMFAMLRWRAWIQSIAAASLLALAAYMILRGATGY
jgi:membrane-bound metal-dependent hydrolase YbcI (DUF457 family)